MNRKNHYPEICEAAGASPILKHVDGDALAELCHLALVHDYPKNNILLYQSDSTHSVFLVLAGKVKLTLANEEGREVIVAIARPGDFFGIIAALDGGTQPANAITTVKSRLAKFDGEALMRWLEKSPASYRALIAEAGGLLRQAYQKIGEHALLGVKERLMYALLDIAEMEGQLEPGSHTIVFTRPTHQELAHRIGSSREVVSRVLKELLDSELLEAEGRVIRVTESALILRED